MQEVSRPCALASRVLLLDMSQAAHQPFTTTEILDFCVDSVGLEKTQNRLGFAPTVRLITSENDGHAADVQTQNSGVLRLEIVAPAFRRKTQWRSLVRSMHKKGAAP
jgi:hypothetical protein